MLNSSSAPNSLSDPPAVEQVINEFFAKTLHIILESRSPHGSSQNYSVKPLTSLPSSLPRNMSRDKWFNLAVKKCPSALDCFCKWHQNDYEQLVIDIILFHNNSKDKHEEIVERWVVQYETRKGKKLEKESYFMYEIAYKKIIILLRTLYATLRFLPAYKVFQKLNLSGKNCNFSLFHRISSFVQPFTREEDSELKDFDFVPIETPCGVLSLSVSYKTTLGYIICEASISMSAQIIPNYVGHPNIDFLRTLRALPLVGSLPTYISLMQKHDMEKEYKVSSTFPTTSSNTNIPQSLLPDNSLSLLSKLNRKIKKYSYSPRISIQGFVGQGLPIKNGSGESNACETLQKTPLEDDNISMYYLMDEPEDKYFCPFAGDDEISTDLLSAQPADTIATNNSKSEDALYGVLVKKLKASTPLRKKPLVTYADSIKELRSYDGIKKLLRQGGLHSLPVC